MADHEPDARLSQIATLWTVVSKAHGDGSAATIRAAQNQLLERYGKVVYRYLVGALRDTDAAEEVSQEFGLRFVRGDLKGVDPNRGRFRDYLKGVLLHLIGDHYRRRKRALRSVSLEHDPPAAAEEVEFSDQQFLEGWRSELLNRAWKALEEHEENTGQPFHSVLRLRAEKADLRSTALAAELSAKLNKPLTSDAVRQTLHRAREKFAEILLGEVAQTLVSPTLADLEQELIDVDLHQYCLPALDRLRGNE
jgi:RNA polymerase sigma factor (sigma-70 family)